MGKDTVKTSYSVYAKEIDAIFDKPGGSEMHRTLNRLFREEKPPESQKVLDIGCGTGISTLYLYDLLDGKGTYQGVDIAEGMIEIARKRQKKEDYQMFDLIMETLKNSTLKIRCLTM